MYKVVRVYTGFGEMSAENVEVLDGSNYFGLGGGSDDLVKVVEKVRDINGDEGEELEYEVKDGRGFIEVDEENMDVVLKEGDEFFDVSEDNSGWSDEKWDKWVKVCNRE